MVIRRTPNSAFDLPTNTTTGRYLRHRAAADAAQRKRQRLLLRNRVLAAGLALLGYFAIGRDLIAVGQAKTSNISMEMQKDTHNFTNQLGNLLRSVTAPNIEQASALKLTSAGTPTKEAGYDAVASSLSQEPVAFSSRLEEWQ
jgi:hypothetical protein